MPNLDKLDQQKMTITVGTQLEHYEIRSKLGEGGMGEVYVAQDTTLDRKVAVENTAHRGCC